MCGETRSVLESGDVTKQTNSWDTFREDAAAARLRITSDKRFLRALRDRLTAVEFARNPGEAAELLDAVKRRGLA